MIGTPTRSDAIKIDPDYAEAVLVGDLNNKLSMLAYVFSGTFPHNHVAEAYRDSGKINLMPDNLVSFHPNTQSEPIRGMFRRLLPNILPRGVDGLLKPELVRDYFIKEIANFRQVLQEAQRFLDNNSYQLANQLLDEFYQEIMDSFDKESARIGKIVSMMAVARDYNDGIKHNQAKNYLNIRHNNSTWDIEQQQDNPIRELVKTNKDISSNSDISLRFDEYCFTYSDNAHQALIPAYAVISDIGRFSHHSLWHRESLRQVVYQTIDHRDAVIINGVKYDRIEIIINERTVDGFRSDNPSFPEIANLLGRPIEQPDGQIIYPEAWARMEVDLIQDYRKGDVIARNKLIYIYNCDTSFGNPSLKKAYEQLDYSLKIEKLSC
ncbi:MAG: hypothetical protein WCJ36_00705 [Candidatus Saccharibacteria bacterium]